MEAAGTLQTKKRVLGRDVGLYPVPEDFDAPLPDEVLAEFEATDSDRLSSRL